jgi:putative addiction module component (TIGR02574 family)
MKSQTSSGRWGERGVDELFKQAVTLPEEERAALAGLLLESLETDVDPDAEEAWSEEIRRRIDEIDAGKVELVPWSVVREQMNQRLRAKR